MIKSGKINLLHFCFAVVVLYTFSMLLLSGCTSNNPGGPVSEVAQGDQTQTAANATATVALTGKVVGENHAPIGGVQVSLMVRAANGTLTPTGLVMNTLTSGEYYFANLTPGVYAIVVSESDRFLESSQLVDLTTSKTASEMTVFAKVLNLQAPTLDIAGIVCSPVNATPLSFAQITMDSGQSIVTDGFGRFTLYYVASGTRRITITQPGMASYSITFDVNGTTAPDADAIVFNGVTFPKPAGSRLIDLGTLTAQYNLHASGILTGTVRRYILDTNGAVTYDAQGRVRLEAYPGYELELWNSDSQGNWTRSQTIRTNQNGTWKIDNLPPFEDNSWWWHLLAAGSRVDISQGQTGNVPIFSNTSAKWEGKNPTLALGYIVRSGETTVIDCNIPTFEYYNVVGGDIVVPVTDQQASVNGGAYTVNPVGSLFDNITFRWTGPGSTTETLINIVKAYSTEENPISIPVRLTSATPTAVNTKTLNMLSSGLRWGRYVWSIHAIDPQTSSIIKSDGNILTVRPAVSDLLPADGAFCEVLNATYTQQFVAPPDPDATYTHLYLVDSAGNVVPRSNEFNGTNAAQFNVTWAPGAPARLGAYTWRVVYYYPDGSSMTTEAATLTYR